MSADDTRDIIARTKVASDNATPSGNGTMVEVLARLFHITGNPRYRERAEGIVRLFSGDNVQYLLSVPGLLNGWELMNNAVQVVLVGCDDGDRDAWRRALFQAPAPARIVTWLDADTALPEGHPAHGKTPHEGRATAYVCVGPTCERPVTDPGALADRLSRR